jgi:hypothetical protein
MTSSENDQSNSLWRDQDYILSNLESANGDFLEKYAHIPELEHQVGRFLNMKQICKEISDNQITGDIVEFGTWTGTGLLLLSRCFPSNENNRKFIGIDSFEGLPESSTIWIKGDFSDTSYDRANDNISKKIGKDKSFKLIQGWFNDSSVADGLRNETQNIALVHFDADLYSSTLQALSLIEPYLIDRKMPIYFLFDDWGCHPKEVPIAFCSWRDANSRKYGFRTEKMSSTRYTRYYKLSFELAASER